MEQLRQQVAHLNTAVAAGAETASGVQRTLQREVNDLKRQLCVKHAAKLSLEVRLGALAWCYLPLPVSVVWLD